MFLFNVLSFFFLCIRTDCLEGYYWFVFNLKIEAVYLCNRKEKGTFILILPAKEKASAHSGLSSVLQCFTWPNYSSVLNQSEYITCSWRQDFLSFKNYISSVVTYLNLKLHAFFKNLIYAECIVVSLVNISESKSFHYIISKL